MRNEHLTCERASEWVSELVTTIAMVTRSRYQISLILGNHSHWMSPASASIMTGLDWIGLSVLSLELNLLESNRNKIETEYKLGSLLLQIKRKGLMFKQTIRPLVGSEQSNFKNYGPDILRVNFMKNWCVLALKQLTLTLYYQLIMLLNVPSYWIKTTKSSKFSVNCAQAHWNTANIEVTTL